MLAVFSKGVLDALPPEIAMLLETHRLGSLSHISLLLHLLKALIQQRFCLYFLQDFQVVDLHHHALAHAHIRHQQWILFDVFDKDELSPYKRQIFLPAELVIALLHL